MAQPNITAATQSIQGKLDQAGGNRQLTNVLQGLFRGYGTGISAKITGQKAKDISSLYGTQIDHYLNLAQDSSISGPERQAYVDQATKLATLSKLAEYGDFETANKGLFDLNEKMPNTLQLANDLKRAQVLSQGYASRGQAELEKLKLMRQLLGDEQKAGKGGGISNLFGNLFGGFGGGNDSY